MNQRKATIWMHGNHANVHGRWTAVRDESHIALARMNWRQRHSEASGKPLAQPIIPRLPTIADFVFRMHAGVLGGGDEQPDAVKAAPGAATVAPRDANECPRRGGEPGC